ncbi:MAG: acyltransferase [Gammaproteobacteria bacterium]|nr:acyltransferase [Gammaproteobacteria bacterium]
MFGTYRILLALMVLSGHLAGVKGIGTYAVFGFYTLSGYLMTLIVQESYGYSRRGLFRYGMNRILRIYPMYWAACVVSIVIILWVGKSFSVTLHPGLYPPENVLSSLKNAFIFFPTGGYPRLVPPSWALTVELAFYALIGLGLSKNRRRVLMWLLLGVIYHVAINVLGLGWKYKYNVLPAASLPFSLGALIYFYKADLLRLWKGLDHGFAPPVLILLILLNWYVGDITGLVFNLSFYVNLLLNAILILSLTNNRALLSMPTRLDKRLGDYSYPIYLLHYQSGLLIMGVCATLGVNIGRPDWRLALLAIPVACILAWILITAIERPIEIIRDRVKKGARQLRYQAIPNEAVVRKGLKAE